MDVVQDAFSLNYPLLCEAFPFHVVLDETLTIARTGPSLARLSPVSLADANFEEIFQLKRPRLPLSYANLKQFSGNAITVQMLSSGLAFKYQVLADPDSHLLFLLGSPVLKDKSDFKQYGLRLNHFASHDAMPDYLMVLKPKEMVIAEKNQLTKKLNEQKKALQEAHDTLEEKVAERTRDLLAAKELAEAGSRAKSEFLAMMSHEIRTPMNGVVGMTQLLRSSPLSDDQRDCVNMIESCGEVLLTIINDILDFSKIEAGQLTLESRRFSLSQCIEEAVDILALKANEKSLEIGYALGRDCPDEITGDSTRLRQILVNLLSNAVKFTSSGQVTIEVEASVKSFDRTQFHFAVKDSGIGIPPDKIGRLFTAFTQTDTSITRKYGGTGLGLTICKRLCNLMGGDIWVESVQGVGSTFHFTIEVPAYHKSLPERPLPTSPVVLLYDHNPVHGQLLARRLSNWQLNPIHFDNWDAFGKALKANPSAGCILNANTLEKDVLRTLEQRRSPAVLLQPGVNANAPSPAPGIRQISKPVSRRHLADLAATLTNRHLHDLQHGTQQDDKLDEQRNAHYFAEIYPLDLALVSNHRLNARIFQKSLEKLGYRLIMPNSLADLVAQVFAERTQTPGSEARLHGLFIDLDADSAEIRETLKQLRTSSAFLRQTARIALVPRNEPPESARNPELFETYIEQPASLEILADILRKTWVLQSAFSA